METISQYLTRSGQNDFRYGQPTTDNGQRAAFTLVELLVVITIISILAALITTAAIGALRRAREAEIKAEINQIDQGLEEYKNRTTAYPPNCQTDDASLAAEPASSPTPLNETQVFNDLKRHLKQAFPRHREPDDLLRVLVGLSASKSSDFPNVLAGGMSAGEAVVFWLGGFSSDPKYPISGEGGPAYPIDNAGNSNNYSQDPIESRKWVFPFAVGRLAPRDDDGFFGGGQRFVEYQVDGQWRRINFWQYTPRNSEQPYLYFDTSRYAPLATNDPPAATTISGLGPDGDGLHVHAFKKLSDSATATTPVQYINPDKFQVIHCGVDGEWDVEAFERMSVHGILENSGNPNLIDDWLTFPDGPFIGEIADTITNFASETRIDDAQP